MLQSLPRPYDSCRDRTPGTFTTGLLLLVAALVSGCDTPAQSGAPQQPAAVTSAAPTSHVVAFDTTATCSASVSGPSGWQPISTNALVSAPLVVTGVQEQAWAVNHPALGSTWLAAAGAQDCVLDDFTPAPLHVDPARVYLHLGESGCERLDPILGSTVDVDRGEYSITSILPVRVTKGGAATEVVEGVRLESADKTKRLIINRADLQRCVQGEAAPSPSRALRPKPSSLPMAGTYGPPPMVVAWTRVGEKEASRATFEFDLHGVQPRRIRKRIRGSGGWSWHAAGRLVERTAGSPVVRVSSSFTDAEEPVVVRHRPLASQEGVAVPNPEWQLAAAQSTAAATAAAWAVLENQYPSADQGAYLRAAQGRARRKQAALDATAATVSVPVPLDVATYDAVRTKRTTVSKIHFPGEGADGFLAVGTAVLSRPSLAQQSRADSARALDRHQAASLRRAIDVAEFLRPLATTAGHQSISFGSGPAAGLTLTASAASSTGTAAMRSGLYENRPHMLQLPALDIPVVLAPESKCWIFAAESLADDDRHGVSVQLGIASEQGFTPLFSDTRSVPRAAVRACWLPNDPRIVLRVVTDAPFVAGVFEEGPSVGLGHVLASTYERLSELEPDDAASLDATLGLPDPIDVVESATTALASAQGETL